MIEYLRGRIFYADLDPTHTTFLRSSSNGQPSFPGTHVLRVDCGPQVSADPCKFARVSGSAIFHALRIPKTEVEVIPGPCVCKGG